MTQIVLHLRTKHDANGNPRRLYLPIDPDAPLRSVTHVIEEGYSGQASLRKHCERYIRQIAIEVPISEYNDWIRYGKDQGIYIP